MTASNAETVRRSFAGQATAFEDPTRAFARSDVAVWMRENSRVSPADVVLEVAAATGLFGRSLAPSVTAVVAIDLTPEMLAEGKRGADVAGLRNVVFRLDGSSSRRNPTDRAKTVANRRFWRHDENGP